MSPETFDTILRLSAEHPELAIELEDAGGRVRSVIFDGSLHPECLPEPDQATVQELERGSIYPKDPYRSGEHQAYEPIASGVGPEDLIRAIRDRL